MAPAPSTTPHASAGHNFGPSAWNPAGIAYIAFISAYTAFLVFGLCYLFMNRSEPGIRMRRFGNILLSVVALHVYVAALFVVCLYSNLAITDTRHSDIAIGIPSQWRVQVRR